MKLDLRKLVKDTLLESAIICEVIVRINDPKKRDLTGQLGKLYRQGLKELRPVKIIGDLGEEKSEFNITLENGDIIKFIRNVNPAYGIVYLNGEEIKMVGSKEIFSSRMTDIVKNAYLETKTTKKRLPIQVPAFK